MDHQSLTHQSSTIDNLLPDRYPQGDLFICDIADAVLKDLIAHMEHPFYSLSKKPETTIRRYEHNGNWIEIVPSVKGLATIYDKDILIYCISQLIAKKNKGEPISKRIRISARELLMFTNRGTSGKDYAAMCEALDRLDGTRIRTNIKRGDEEQFSAFGLIDSAAVARKFGLDGRLLWCEVTLSDWVFNAVNQNDYLTLHRDYFRLRKPLERRIYEIARKHCGRQPTWSISVELLYKKTGSRSKLKQFRYLLKDIAENNHLPDYFLSIEEKDMVVFKNRSVAKPVNVVPNSDIPKLDDDIYHDARLAAPGWDIYFLKDEWLSFWDATGRPVLHDPNAAFLAFCRRRYEKNGSPA
ncbi:replication initiator protein A [Bartonella sp. HY406]|uniref:replication initiator protein A n=1 Tax=Bartonella sp. HY406 TaxID=2979331 RepID=UPI0021C78767|nr:replication initiator protein A [Bartonella sp. HY406]UXN05103.1 replication initiator protein A [Bartonella sp. HY406]UXN05108.1 replication initiator protein A [Bartonella sp. HY406]